MASKSVVLKTEGRTVRHTSAPGLEALAGGDARCEQRVCTRSLAVFCVLRPGFCVTPTAALRPACSSRSALPPGPRSVSFPICQAHFSACARLPACRCTGPRRAGPPSAALLWLPSRSRAPATTASTRLRLIRPRRSCNVCWRWCVSRRSWQMPRCACSGLAAAPSNLLSDDSLKSSSGVACCGQLTAVLTIPLSWPHCQ